MRPSFCVFRLFLFVFFGLLCAGDYSPLWALTRAGTSIDNRALAVYTDAETGMSALLQSNTVSAQVQPLEALSLAPNQAVQNPAGAPLSLAHRLTNTGNTLSQFVISVSNASGDAFDVSDLKIVRDLNDNGVADIGEPEVGTQALALEAGDSLSVVIGGTVPSSAAPDSSAKLLLNAQTVLQNASATNTDTISVSLAQSLQLFKAASVSGAKAGDLVTFTLSALNRGNSAPLPIPIAVSLDGAPRNLVLVRDTIPANTSLSAFTSAGSGLALYHRVGDAEKSFVSRAPQDLNSVDAIALGVANFPAGSALQTAFSVQLHANIGGEIRNTAQLVFANQSGEERLDSNQVRVSVPTSAPSIAYHRDPTFSRVTGKTTFDTPLHIEVNDAELNLDSTVIEHVTVTNVSSKTGDVMRVEAIETSPNSGVFRVVTTPIRESDDDIPNNGTVETASGDIITASFMHRGAPVSTSILVDPLGIVFDSRTNAPIPGARVTLIDVTGSGNGGKLEQAAQVFLSDGSPAPSTVVTNADGEFHFPEVEPGVYRFEIVPPAGYVFPSKVRRALLAPNRNINEPASYGGTFSVVAREAPVQIDVPLDGQSAPSGLFLEKTAAHREVEIGEFLDYELHFKNASASALPAVTLSDSLPAGFKLQIGSARLNGQPFVFTPPTGRQVSFDIGALALDGEARLSYRVLVGIGSKIGKNVNRARATTNGAQSNEASATVEVQGGTFDDKGIIVGRVWIDSNRDGQMQAGEIGIPGVRVWMEDGTFVLTDEDGKYSIYGLEARTHVVKVDVSTLPNGVRLKTLSSRYSKGGASYIIDLKKGELHKVNFADGAATPEIIANALARRTLAAQGESEAAQSLSTTLTPDGSVFSPGDVRALPSSGFVGNANQNRFGANSGENGGSGLSPTQHELPLNSRVSNLPPAPIRKAPLAGLEALLPTLTPELGFVDLKDGDTLALAQANVRVKGAAGATFKLSVNAVEVPQNRVGQKSEGAGGKASAWEFVGVRLNAGRNTLRLEQLDSFGIARGSVEISVVAPGDLGRLEIGVPTSNPFADGRSLAKISVRLLDAKGAIVSTRTALTLEATVGQWQVVDLNAREPGAQVFIEGGRAEFDLLSPSQAGNCDLRVSSGVLHVESRIAFVPELRPLFVNGLASAKLNLFGFKANGAGVLRTQDIFENEDNARGALFVKGRILGSSLLTLRYDSQKREDDRLFRDIQPDAYYPIYGDAASRGFDAQSTGKLYVRVDNQKSYVLYGDYTTSSLDAARGLGDYNRSLNGFKTHFEKGRATANVFASNDNAAQVVDEIRGNGTSGTYLLRSGEARPQSEKVEIIVRDRNQPSVVLQTTPQTRFTDYTLDGLSQGIVFRSPVPSVDSDLNPIFIRVTYEVEQGGPKFLVAGVDAQLRLNNKVEVGAAYSRDQNPQSPYSLRSVNATVQLAPGTTLVGEWAQSDGSVLGNGAVGGSGGNAQRIELLHEDRKLAARVFVGRADAGFNNPASLLSQGRQEASLKATLKLDGANRVVAEAIRSNDIAGGGTRTGAQIALQRSLGDGVQIEVGARRVKDSGTPFPGAQDAPADFTSLRAKVTAPVPNQPKANVSLEYERALQGSGQVLAIGGDYQIANRGRIYVRHELISSLSGRYGLNDGLDQGTTLFGIDAATMKNGRAFSEYRVGGGINGRDAQASIGLRNAWNLGEGVRFNTTFERIRDLNQSTTISGTGNSTALTGALEYTRSRDFKGTARLELRNGQSDSVLGTLGVALKINPSLSLLGKGVYSRGSSGFGLNLNNTNQSRALVGLAYRSAQNDRLQALLKYELRNGTLAARLQRRVQILSANVNYQATRRWTLGAHYALQDGSDTSNDLASRARLQILSGRATYNLGRRADLSLLSSFASGGGVSQAGIGAEVGFRATSNLRLSAGYLLGHFHDRDQFDLDASEGGFYLRFGYEFDESAFGGLAP